MLSLKIWMIYSKKEKIWQNYSELFNKCRKNNYFDLPCIPEYATNNGHLFYLVFNDPEDRSSVIENHKGIGITSVFHYLSLHKSQYFQDKHDRRELSESDRYSDCLLRLPLFYELKQEEVIEIVQNILN